MHLTSTLLLCAAGLSIAAPAPAFDLFKRENNLCGLGNYAKVTEARVADDIKTLKGKTGTVSIGANSKKQVACHGHTSVNVFVGKTAKNFSLHEIGFKVEDTYRACYGGNPSSGAGDKKTNFAFQHFGDGYNILVHGNADC